MRTPFRAGNWPSLASGGMIEVCGRHHFSAWRSPSLPSDARRRRNRPTRRRGRARTFIGSFCRRRPFLMRLCLQVIRRRRRLRSPRRSSENVIAGAGRGRIASTARGSCSLLGDRRARGCRALRTIRRARSSACRYRRCVRATSSGGATVTWGSMSATGQSSTRITRARASCGGARRCPTSSCASRLMGQTFLRAVRDLDLDPRLTDARHRDVTELLVNELLPELEVALG